MFLQNLSLLTIRIASCSSGSSLSSYSRCTIGCETSGTPSSCCSYGTHCTWQTRLSHVSRGSRCPCRTSGPGASGTTSRTSRTFNDQVSIKFYYRDFCIKHSNAFATSIRRQYRLCSLLWETWNLNSPKLSGHSSVTLIHHLAISHASIGATTTVVDEN